MIDPDLEVIPTTAWRSAKFPPLFLLIPVTGLAQTYTAGPRLALAIPDNAYNGTTGSMGCSTIPVPSGGGDTIASATVQIAMAHTSSVI